MADVPLRPGVHQLERPAGAFRSPQQHFVARLTPVMSRPTPRPLPHLTPTPPCAHHSTLHTPINASSAPFCPQFDAQNELRVLRTQVSQLVRPDRGLRPPDTPRRPAAPCRGLGVPARAGSEGMRGELTRRPAAPPHPGRRRRTHGSGSACGKPTAVRRPACLALMRLPPSPRHFRAAAPCLGDAVTCGHEERAPNLPLPAPCPPATRPDGPGLRRRRRGEERGPGPGGELGGQDPPRQDGGRRAARPQGRRRRHWRRRGSSEVRRWGRGRGRGAP